MMDSTKQPKLLMSRSVIAKKEAKQLRDNGQNFTGVWLDENSERTDIKISTDFNREFENLFDYSRTFSGASKCIAYLTFAKDSKILFITSHKNALKVVPIIEDEDFSQIHYIYIFCSNEVDKDSWTSKKLGKFRGSFVSKDELFQKVKDDILTINFENGPLSNNSQSDEIRNEHLINTMPPITVFNSKITNNSIKSLNKDSVWFIRYQLLFDILLKLEKSTTEKDEMIYACSQFYKDDDIQLKKIEQFEKDAENASQSIYWYTKESFIVHLLNRACGTQNIDEIYPFRLFIRNLHGELVKLDAFHRETRPCGHKTTVFRGKPLALSTLENLKNNINGLVSMNGFLSTTRDEVVAECFSGMYGVKPDLIPVLFKLNIDHTVTNKPYADIPSDRHAMKDQEKEVLFSIGSVWRINTVTQLNNEHESSKPKMYCVELTLSNEDDQESVELADYLKKEIGDTSSIWTLGDFLTKIGEYEQAENYYLLLEKVSFGNQDDLATIYNRIAYLRHERKDHSVAIEYYNKAMECTSKDTEAYTTAVYNQYIIQTESIFCPPKLRRRFENDDVITKSLITKPASKPIILNNIGRMEHQRGHYFSAIQHYNDALELLLNSEFIFLLEISALYNNIGGVEYSKGNYSGAIEKFRLAIEKLSKLDSAHPWIKEYTENCKAAQGRVDNPKKKLSRTE